MNHPAHVLLQYCRVRDRRLLGEKWRAQVSLPEVGQDDDDEFACVCGTLGDLDSNVGSCPRANSGQDALFTGQTAGHRKGVLILDLDHFINNFQVQYVRDETGPNALDLGPSRFERLALPLLRDDGTVLWLDCDALEARFTFF